MRVLFDTTVFSAFLDPDVRYRVKGGTELLDNANARVRNLIQTLQGENSEVVISSLVLAEVLPLVEPEEMRKRLDLIESSPAFVVTQFTKRMAIENARLDRSARLAGDKRGGSGAKWQHVKVDRLLVATALAEQVTRIYSDDDDLTRLCSNVDIDVVSLASIDPIPEQVNLI